MISLLALQMVIALSDADRASFNDYRECVMEQVASADLKTGDKRIIKAAQKSCESDKVPAGLELAADELEMEANGRKPSVDADVRMKYMENLLVADARGALAIRRAKVK